MRDKQVAELFIEPRLRDSWWVYLSAASHIESELEHCLGSGRAAEVLFERESGIGDTPPSREAGARVAATLARNAPGASNQWAPVNEADNLITDEPFTFDWQSGGDVRLNISRGHAGTLQGNQTMAVANICSALGAANGGANDNDAQGGKLIVARSTGAGWYTQDDKASLRAEPGGTTFDILCFESRFARNGRGAPSEIVPPLKAESGQTGKGDGAPLVHARHFGVRRLSPKECERLQGFPDNWTAGQSDSARYRQLGNAVCRNVAEWIGHRIMEAA